MKATQGFYIKKNGDVMRVYKLADGQQLYRKISFESGELPKDWNKDGEWDEMDASCFRPRVEGMMGSTTELSVEELDEAKQKEDAEYELLKACEGETFYSEKENEYIFVREIYAPSQDCAMGFEATRVNVADFSFLIEDIFIGKEEEFESMEGLKKRLKPVPFDDFVNAVNRVDKHFLESHIKIHDKICRNNE